MAKYILDTNIITYLEEQDSPFHSVVNENLKSLSNGDDVYISLLSLYEIEFGISVSRDEKIKDIFRKMKKSVLSEFSVLPLNVDGSIIFGDIKADYMNSVGMSSKAIKRHDIDLMLASTAIAEKSVLVSNDAIFEQIKGLRSNFLLENWAF